MPAAMAASTCICTGLSASVRDQGRDRVSVEVAFDALTAAGPTPLPAWFRKALKRIPKAWPPGRPLIPSRQKEIVRYLTGVEIPRSRAATPRRSLRVLSGTKDRFMPGPGADGARLRLQCVGGAYATIHRAPRRPVSLRPVITRSDETCICTVANPKPPLLASCTGLVVQCGEAE